MEPSTAVELTLDKTWVDPDTNAVHRLALGDGRVYLATDRPMVKVIDVGGSGPPTLAGSWDPFLDVSDQAVSRPTLFVSSWELDSFSTVDRVDVSNPTRPVRRWRCGWWIGRRIWRRPRAS